MRLPIAFFGYKQTGDLLQRIEDHSRIEQFLTTHAPNLIFAFFSVATLCIVLGIYSINILSVFVVGTMLYVLWVTLFLKRRKILDYQFFEQQSDQKDRVYEMDDRRNIRN
ncbi:MAG: ABC transporter transmembrane domain-containing protein [Prevotella sp.]|nr:ABC transporter transmembrane domain-containing protein [Prevotella sp.]